LERIAIIDLGSNTARLLLVDVTEDGHFQIVDQLKEAPRLGEGMERDGFLKPQRIQETIPTYIATNGINIPIIDNKSEITVRTFCQSKISFSLKAMHKAIKSDAKTT
jgi:hypothetical protein